MVAFSIHVIVPFFNICTFYIFEGTASGQCAFYVLTFSFNLFFAFCLLILTFDFHFFSVQKTAFSVRLIPFAN